METPPPVPVVPTPATVVATARASRPGSFSMSSRVTVPPDAPPSRSISGTVYSTTSASSIITPAPSVALTNWILFAVTLTPVTFFGVYPTKLKRTSYEPGLIGLMLYSPSKSVLPPVTWLPLRNSTTFTNGSGSPVSTSVTLPCSAPEPTCAEAVIGASSTSARMAAKAAKGRKMAPAAG